MVYAGVCDEAAANARFDRMSAFAAEVPYAKQPIVERSSGRVLGYCGVAPFELDGTACFEFGYRLCTDARGQGYATEAALAVLDLAHQHHDGSIIAMINPTNEPSMNVIAKVGFTFWKQDDIDGDLTNLYRIEVGHQRSG